MSESNGKSFIVDRVIAALDACCWDVETLAAAVEMAARLNAEVAGLFVEDENLLRLWSLPAARHVTLAPSAEGAPGGEIEHQMRALAAQAEAELRAAAIRLSVPWSFRVLRGLPRAELGEATVPRDLLVVGSTRELAGLPLRFRSPLQGAVRQLERSWLHVPRRVTFGRPLAVVRAGSPLAHRTLAAAMRVAGPQNRTLDVTVVGAPQHLAAAASDAASWVESLAHHAQVRTLAQPTVAGLQRALTASDADLLIVAEDVLVQGDGEQLQDVLLQTGYPFMVIR